MTTDEFREIWMPALRAYQDLHRDVYDSCEFEEMLGVLEYTKWRQTPAHHDQQLPTELTNLLRMIANSPHVETLIKVYKVRHGSLV